MENVQFHPAQVLEPLTKVVRNSIVEISPLASDAFHVEFATLAPTQLWGHARQDDPGTGVLALPEKIPGRLRVDWVSDRIVRIRYGEGGRLPVNDNPVLLPQAPSGEGGVFQGGEGASFRFAGKDYSLEFSGGKYMEMGVVRNDDRKEVLAVGGAENNFLQVWNALSTGLCRRKENGQTFAVEKFSLPVGEAVFGFGEKFGPLDKVGQTLTLDMEDGKGVVGQRSYKNVPFFMTTAGYGVYFNHSCRMTFHVGSRSVLDVQAVLDDDFLDYFVILGDLKEILDSYGNLTGRVPMPPEWSFGFWHGKCSFQSADEVEALVGRMRQEQIPCDVIHLDTGWFEKDSRCDLRFSPTRFPDPERFFQRMRDQGVHVCLWQLPYIPGGSELFRELERADAFVKTPDGARYQGYRMFGAEEDGELGVVDYSNPAAVAIMREEFRRLFALGASVIKTDFAEDAPYEGVYHGGVSGKKLHNLYPFLYNQAIFEITKECVGEGLVWARSAWAGNQRFPLHWGGDSTATFENMTPQLRGGLSLGMSGFAFWSEDIGGFFTMGPETPAYWNLKIRWMQLGLFHSHARLHGLWAPTPELASYPEEIRRLCVESLRLRYRLLPYILATAADCCRRMLPFMRPLALEYQRDRVARGVEDEYLFGANILLAPVMTAENLRDVYFPEGEWLDFHDGRRHDGGKFHYGLHIPLERPGLFVKAGAIIPMREAQNHCGEHAEGQAQLTLKVARFSGDGESVFRFPWFGREVTASYRAVAGEHTVELSVEGLPFDTVWLG